MKKPKNKNTKAYAEWEIRKLKNKCLRLWKEVVKLQAENRCEICWWLLHKTNKIMLQAHHIESYELNKSLRYSKENGVAVCPRHHKFSLDSFHRSLILACNYITLCRKNDFDYLIIHRDDKPLETKGFYLMTISKLEAEKQKLLTFNKGKEVKNENM